MAKKNETVNATEDEITFFSNQLSEDENLASTSEIKFPYAITSHAKPYTGFYSVVPARYFLSFMVFWATFLVYALRVNLSVALVAMVKQQPSNSSVDYECSFLNGTSGNSSSDNNGKGEFDWDEKTKGLVLGSFFYGYVVTQLPGGRMAEVYGGKWLLGIGVLVTSVFTLLMPIAARWNYVALIATRVLAGLGEGVTYPACFALFAKWIPVQEISFQLAFSQNGAQIGTVVTMPIAAVLCNLDYDNGWPLVFYIFGGLGCLWCLLWLLFTSDAPENHKGITRKELLYIQENRKTSSTREQRAALPWKSILTSIPVWTLALTKMCIAWSYYTILTELPNYMQVILHFDIQKGAWQSSILYLALAITVMIAGFSADYIRSLNYFSITTIRKVFQTLASVGSAVCLASIPLVGCDRLSIFLLLVATTALIGFGAGGSDPSVLDMCPGYAGTVFGICNTVSNFSGIFAPMVTGIITNENDSMASWSWVFYISAAINLIGTIIFIIFGTGELQPWAASSPEYSAVAATDDDHEHDHDEIVTSQRETENDQLIL